MLVHPSIAQLTSKGKHQRPRTPIIRLYVQENGHVGIFRLQVLVLTGQRLTIGSGGTGDGKGRATAFAHSSGFGARLAENSLFKTDLGPRRQAANLFDQGWA